MTGNCLLDTNAAIARFAEDTALLKRLENAEVFHSSIVLGELYFGAEKSRKVTENLARLERFVQGRIILICDLETARIYGRVRQRLMLKGRPIPINDVWIAATALQHDLTLLTRDAHFQHVDGLRVEHW